ncbi:histone-lysine N-methyltransferase SETDB2-like [Micropterus dolomieu]|uniref:histone-lysine N-methyltransferase SETDB2-like n=1 Tax=Micropterus dolomieu TaxID=147949 RepID=UPI001E8D85FD|nr:histone-lysine N-methyltransferase SETDB2-like [Micropterus dolomieu]
MEEDPLDPQEVERAKTFWAGEDVDQVFNGVYAYLDYLKRVLKKNAATDKEYVQAFKLLESLDCCPPASTPDSSVVQVVIGSVELLLPSEFSHHSPSSSPSSSPLLPSNGLSSSAAPPAGREELLPPLTPVQLQYQPHLCCSVSITLQVALASFSITLQVALALIASVQWSLNLTSSCLLNSQVLTVSAGGPEPPSPSAGDRSPAQQKIAVTAASPEEAAAVQSVNGTETEANSFNSLKRTMKVEDITFLDASKEGNVSRFINHSCQPNLFIQNVFTDSHDPGFPVVAFFTSRAVKAGTELTWNYSADTQRKQEVPCLCGSSGCQGHFSLEETLCDMCEVEGETQ